MYADGTLCVYDKDEKSGKCFRKDKTVCSFSNNGEVETYKCDNFDGSKYKSVSSRGTKHEVWDNPNGIICKAESIGQSYERVCYGPKPVDGCKGDSCPDMLMKSREFRYKNQYEITVEDWSGETCNSDNEDTLYCEKNGKQFLRRKKKVDQVVVRHKAETNEYERSIVEYEIWEKVEVENLIQD